MQKTKAKKKEPKYVVVRDYKGKYSYEELVARIVRSHIKK